MQRHPKSSKVMLSNAKSSKVMQSHAKPPLHRRIYTSFVLGNIRERKVKQSRAKLSKVGPAKACKVRQSKAPSLYVTYKVGA